MKNINFTVLDVETATTNRMICQVGIVVVSNGKIVEEKSFLIQPPNNYYDENCVKIHHITPSMTISCPSFKEIWPELKPHLECQLLVCHGADFDIDTLKKNMEYYNIPEFPILGITCTYKLFQLKLEHVAKAYNVTLGNHHDALVDARCCAEVFLKYLDGIIMDRSKISYADIYLNDMEKYRRDLQRYKDTMDIRWQYRLKSSCDLPENNIFQGKNVVITGELTIGRDLLKTLITNLGGNILSGVSKKLDIVVLGAFPGPTKMKSIEELVNKGSSIQYMTEQELFTHISDYVEKYDVFES